MFDLQRVVDVVNPMINHPQLLTRNRWDVYHITSPTGGCFGILLRIYQDPITMMIICIYNICPHICSKSITCLLF